MRRPLLGRTRTAPWAEWCTCTHCTNLKQRAHRRRRRHARTIERREALRHEHAAEH